MVALNTAYAAPKNAADPKNRVGDFFYEDRASVGKNRWASRLNTQEKSCYHYETASGRSNGLNRDPIQEQGGLNLYAMVQNNPLNFADLLGLDLLKNPFSRERNEQYNDLLKELNIRSDSEIESIRQEQQALAESGVDLGKGIMSSAYGAAKDGVNYLKNGALKAGAGALYDAVTDYFEPNQIIEEAMEEEVEGATRPKWTHATKTS